MPLVSVSPTASIQTPNHEIVKLHPKQWQVYNSKSRFRTLVAGRRFGKTELAKAEIRRQAVIPKSLIYYVCPSYKQAKTVFWDKIKEAFPRSWISKTHEVELTITLINGTKVALKGADNEDSLRGVGVDLIVLDEYQNFKPGVWMKVLRPTLSDTGGRALFIGTPMGYGDDTYKDSFYNLYNRGLDTYNIRTNQYRSWQFRTMDSPFIADSEIEAARRDSDPRSFEQEYMASFVNMSGRVYYTFDRQVHMRSCPYNPDLPIMIGMDFNVGKMCSVVAQKQKDDTLHVVKEFVIPNSNTVEMMEDIDRFAWHMDKSKVGIYPDASGNVRQQGRGESNLDLIRQFGYIRLKYSKKNPNVVDRINTVNRCFINAEGDVKIYVDPSCKNFISSCEQLMYKESTDKVDDTSNLDHIMDAFGYIICQEYPLREISLRGFDV